MGTIEEWLEYIPKYLIELAKFSPVFAALFAKMCPNCGHYPL